MNVVVLAGTDAAAPRRGRRELESDTTRAAVFVGDVDHPRGRAALQEFVTELFDHPDLRTPNPTGVAAARLFAFCDAGSLGVGRSNSTAGSRRWAKRRRVRISTTPVTRMRSALVIAAAASQPSDVAT